MKQSVKLAAILKECDRVLKPGTFVDYERAVNGLQVENTGIVTKMAAAVDGTLATLKMAVAAKADLLLVHHGLFWSSTIPWTGNRYRMLQLLLQNNLAVYSCHLPLDAHPVLGNNAQLATQLGFKKLKPFFFEKGNSLGFKTNTIIRRAELARKLELALTHPAILLPGGPEICRRIGIVSGSAGAQLKQALDEGVDTLITGEGPHWTHAMAEDLGMNVFYGGHYSTETFGVKALASHLAKKFHLEWCFLDHPSGL